MSRNTRVNPFLLLKRRCCVFGTISKIDEERGSEAGKLLADEDDEADLDPVLAVLGPLDPADPLGPNN